MKRIKWISPDESCEECGFPFDRSDAAFETKDGSLVCSSACGARAMTRTEKRHKERMASDPCYRALCTGIKGIAPIPTK